MLTLRAVGDDGLEIEIYARAAISTPVINDSYDERYTVTHH